MSLIAANSLAWVTTGYTSSHNLPMLLEKSAVWQWAERQHVATPPHVTRNALDKMAQILSAACFPKSSAGPIQLSRGLQCTSLFLNSTNIKLLGVLRLWLNMQMNILLGVGKKANLP